jgi:UPF0755 protein
MSDLDIGLPFHDVDAPPRSRVAKHRRRRQRGRDRRRSAAAFLVIVLVFALLGGGAWYGYGKVKSFFTAPDYTGGGAGEVSVQVEQGDTATDIANLLYEKGVVKSAKAFTNAAEDDPNSQTLQPGTYTLRKQMKASLALALMLDPSSRSVKRFTIPEGLSAKQVYERLSKQTGFPVADFQAAAKDANALGLPPWAGGNVEGFLFPDTYDLEKNDTAATIIKTMVDRMLKVLAEDDFVALAEKGNLTPQEALIVASLVEGEGIPDDFSKIARVVYNRIKANMPLEFDSTTNYGRELAGQPRKNRFAYNELRDPNNKYRTHDKRGLPPTPIANPGKAALDAAVSPADGDWLFFVLIDKAGHSAFAVKLSDHEANVDKCKKLKLC